jgi:protein transport protein SEC24
MTNLAGRYPAPSSYPKELPTESRDEKVEHDSLPRLNSDFYLAAPTFAVDEEGKTPSASSNYVCESSGSACPHFARLSTKSVPAWPSLQFTCSVPLGCVFQPFAEVHSGDAVQIVHSACSEGPLRCSHCQGFVNPFFGWEEAGMKARCNLCSKLRDVPFDYFSPVTPVGLREDARYKPELSSGLIDFVPPSNIIYSSEAPVMVFVIDCSYLSASSGFLPSALSTLRAHIRALPLETEIAIILFNEALHFLKFELSRNGTPSLITVADVDDPFIPDPLLFVSPHLLIDQLGHALDLIEKFGSIANPNRAISCAKAAVSIAAELIGDRHCPGTVAVFQASSGKLGKQLSENFTKYCLERNICIDLFASADSVVSLGLEPLSTTISELNGEQHMVTTFELGVVLTSWLYKPRYYNCVLRVRCSKSLAIESIDFGKRKGTESCAFPRMGNDSTIGSVFSVTETINPGQDVFLQLACLYTRSDGVRLIRVININVRSTPQAVQVFKLADLDTVGFLMAKQALAEHLARPEKISIKESLIVQLVALLHAYRVNCAVSSGSGQLILPDSLKVLPLMLSGFLKQTGIRPRVDKTSVDEHCVALRTIQQWNVRKVAFMCLPRILSVYPGSDLQLVHASRQKISAAKIYLVDRDDELWFYVGRDVEPNVVETWFGRHVSDRMLDVRRAPVVDVQLSVGNQTVHEIIRGRKNVRLKCILASSTVGETKFSNVLMEDRIGNESSYIDWLCSVHRLIQEKIDY